jgi:uncharacterized protein GlcG (DUF336 family)
MKVRAAPLHRPLALAWLFGLAACGGGGAGGAGPIAAPDTAPLTYTGSTAVTSAGAISPTVQRIVPGGSATLTLAPAPGAVLVSITGCAGVVGNGSYTTGPITADCTVVARFGSADEAQPISVYPVKGPLAGALLTIQGLGANGLAGAGPPVLVDRSAATGALRGLLLPAAATGLLLIDARTEPGTIDLTTGLEPLFGQMRSVIAADALRSGGVAVVSPFTEAAVTVADVWLRRDGPAADPAATLAEATALVKRALGFGLLEHVDLFTTAPLLTGAVGEDRDALLRYRVAIEALAALIVRLTERLDSIRSDLTIDVVFQALLADLAADGQIDGRLGQRDDEVLSALPDLASLLGAGLAELEIPNTTRAVVEVPRLLNEERALTGASAIAPLEESPAAYPFLRSGAALPGGCGPLDGVARLLAEEVDCLVAQAVEIGGRLNQTALTVAVTDRVGNVLGIYQVGDAPSRVTIRSGLLDEIAGLDNVPLNVLPPVGDSAAARAAISKALTAAYFSSAGNAFTTRTAGFIIQNHFPPLIPNTPGGPLFGVQFSQLSCGDIVQKGEAVGEGSRAAPLGVAADPGGFPLYKNGAIVGALGVVAGADSIYGIDLDPDPNNLDIDVEETIAHSAIAGFTPALEIRADRITAGGIMLPYSDSDRRLLTPATRRGASPAGGAWITLPGWYPGTGARTGRLYGAPGSGFEPASGMLEGYFTLPRLPIRDSVFPGVGAAGLRGTEVEVLLKQSLDVARRTRSQIRRPLGSYAQVTVTVVDAAGTVLGQARTPDALIDSSDVTVQKARTAAFFSRDTAANRLILTGAGSYLSDSQSFFARADVFRNGRAFSSRAIANIHRPNFPDGIDARPRGPLSKGVDWSPFNVGLQLDQILPNLQLLNPEPTSCTVNTAGQTVDIGLANGMTIFPGGFPIYREVNGQFVIIGAIGASGDGSDQSDIIGLLGLERGTTVLTQTPPPGAPVGYRAPRHPPADLRVDGLKYAQCPQSPFLDSLEQNPCEGL